MVSVGFCFLLKNFVVFEITIVWFIARLYYRRVEEGKQYPVLCRRLVSINEEFISNKSPSAGFDFTSGKRIEQKLVDYNQEAERFGGICPLFPAMVVALICSIKKL